MDIATAQSELRRAYVGGGPGAIVSSIVWFVAAFVETHHGIPLAFKMLFLGGFVIFPLATLVCRFGFRRAKESRDNPLGLVALESTIAMIGGLIAAWLFVPFAPAFVFPLAAIAVGTHYLVFKTAYGDRLYWILGAIITCVGLFGIFNVVPIPGGRIMDTTGAGDLYAAGVLHGLGAGRDLFTCGRLGGMAASECISHLGARPQQSLSALAAAAGIG